MSRVLGAALRLAAAMSCSVTLLAQATQLSLRIGDIETPALSAHAVSATVSGAGWRDLDLRIGRLSVAGHEFTNVNLKCADAYISTARLACARGVLHAGEAIPLSFAYSMKSGELTLELRPGPGETWRAKGHLAGAQTEVQVIIDSGRVERVARWLPAAFAKVSAGRTSGTVRLAGSAARAQLTLEGLAFADASGMHAGEKIGGTIHVDASEKDGLWQWAARVAWNTGEVYWQPLFASAVGQELTVQGRTAGGRSEILGGELKLPQVGVVSFNGRWNHVSSSLETLEARGARLHLAPLYEQVLKPLLQETALADLRIEGGMSVALKVEGGAVAAADVQLHDVAVEDSRQRRFAFSGIEGRVPWRRDGPGTGEIAFDGAELLKLPLGATRIAVRTKGTAVALGTTRVPVLDGAVVVRDFAAAKGEDGWGWRFSSELEAISMAQLTKALGLPVMYGALTGVAPEVRYSRKALAMDGSLTIGVFDGSVIASKLELIDPFGRAPRLLADLRMTNLDLELLTRAFDFGTITGRIDAQLGGLELVGWQPVRFDLRVDSSPGKYPKRISQRAVQNISALGGAGAAAALQRSFLRFFEQFGYARIGLSCRLLGDVCEMDGIRRSAGGFVIIEGGGVPAISVIGYNHRVSWRELVERLKRITQENVTPIVK